MTELIPHHFMLYAVTAVIFSGCDQPSTQTRVIDQSMEMMPNIERKLDIALVDMEVQDIDVSFDQGFTLDIPNQPGGNPLNPEVALYPYPSDFYLTPNTNSLTGYQVSISDQVALRTMPSLAFENQDGFSRMPMILSAWPRGVDQLSLPDPIDHGTSIDPRSTTLLIEHGSLKRIAHLAEVDLTSADPSKGTLIIRPVIVLDPNQTYSVVIQSGLLDLDGQPYVANAAFTALKDNQPTGFDALERLRPSFEQTRAVITDSGLEMASVILAWSFHTRSQESVTETLLKLQEQSVDWPLGDIQVLEENQDAQNMLISGEVEMPLYVGENGIQYDQRGEPQLIGSKKYPFSMAIPNSVFEASSDPLTIQPRPVIMYGHGFLGSHEQAIRSSFNELCRRAQISAIGLNFGMHSGLLPLLIRGINGELNAIRLLRAEVMQTMVNYTVMTRYISLLNATHPALDPTKVYYMGISNGGTFGFLYAATSLLVEKAVLVVGGGGLSHFLQRATQWHELGGLAKRIYPDSWMLQLYLSQLQEQLDPIDPINYVDHLIEPRFTDRRPLRAQLHMAINDSQVNNLVTEWVARSARIPVFTPSPKQIWGLEEVETPLSDSESLAQSSALIVYDEMVTPYPEGNIAPSEDNFTHNTVRQLESYQLHIIDFLESGILQQRCMGPCNPE